MFLFRTVKPRQGGRRVTTNFAPARTGRERCVMGVPTHTHTHETGEKRGEGRGRVRVEKRASGPDAWRQKFTTVAKMASERRVVGGVGGNLGKILHTG